MIKYSVCIATYKRPDFLRKLIESLLIQKKIEPGNIEIIIVDNDSNESAKTVVEKYIGKHDCEIAYYIQQKKNISLTRNVALEKIRGEYIFFIDDDEYADENWMIAHINNIKKYDADAAFGKIISYFPESTPKWIRNCMVFHKHTNPSGQKPANFTTANTIAKSELFIEKGYRFDPAYGITGGSDFQLFSKVEKAGYKLVSSYDAITYDFIPESRANIKWLISRVARTGNNWTRTKIEQAEGINKILVRLKEFGSGIIQAIIAFVFSLLLFWNPTKSLNWFLTAVSNSTKPLAVFGIYISEYKLK